MYLIVYITIHFIYGIIAAGLILNDLQKRYPNIAKVDFVNDLVFSWIVGLLLGPLSLCFGVVLHKWIPR